MACANMSYCFFGQDCSISFVCLSNGLLVYYRSAEVVIVEAIDGKSQYRMDNKNIEGSKTLFF